MNPDLFSPSDTAALLAIRAAIDDRQLAAAELEALFASAGVRTGACDLEVEAERELVVGDAH